MSEKIEMVSEIANKKRSKYFPHKKGKIEIIPVQYEELLPHIGKHFKRVFPMMAQGDHVTFNKKQLKQRASLFKDYRRIHWECFIYKYDGEFAGWFMGEMEDHETFYLRNVGILPKFKNKGIFSLFLKLILDFLKEIGYQRVSSHHSPENAHIYHLQLKNGFMIIGSEAHERYGMLIKMIKLFDKKRNEIFRKKYC